jgi:hypothetical protein
VTAARTRRQTAFATSDRRIRGAIIARLREATDGLSLARLEAAIGDGRVRRLVGDLEREGLLKRTRRRLTLPG